MIDEKSLRGFAALEDEGVWCSKEGAGLEGICCSHDGAVLDDVLLIVGANALEGVVARAGMTFVVGFADVDAAVIGFSEVACSGRA